ncbi:hypothetical protein E2320_009038, partial [Naja naja]
MQGRKGYFQLARTGLIQRGREKTALEKYLNSLRQRCIQFKIIATGKHPFFVTLNLVTLFTEEFKLRYKLLLNGTGKPVQLDFSEIKVRKNL